MLHIAFVEPQKSAARGKIIVHNIKDFSIDTLSQPRQNNGFRAIVNIGQGYCVRAAQVKVYPKGINPDSSRDRLLSGTIHRSWTKNDVAKASLFPILHYKFVLLDLGVTVS